MSPPGRIHSVLTLISSLILRPTVSLVQAQDLGSGVEPRREYNVVDFLWSGSGSGSGEDGIGTAWVTTTVFRTRVQTLLLPTPVLPQLCSACGSSLCSACGSSADCSSSSCLPSSTPKSPVSTTSSRPNKLVPHQRYWLVTVIKIDTPVPDIHIFEKRLEKIYQIAFHRQQEKHLRLDATNETVFKRSADNRQDVTVKMHHFRRRPDQGVMELIYSVTLSGSPVDAVVASNDMNYVTEKEVSTHLGYPVLTKAEPYYKASKSLELAEEGNIWLFVIIAVCLAFVFLIIVALYLVTSKRKRGKESMAKDELDSGQSVKTQTPVLTRTDVDKKSNVPLGIKSYGDKGVQQTGRPPTAIKDNVPKDTSKTMYSPKSYLSMPSVRAFPRGDTIPPLEQMLETESGSTRSLSRHHSEVGDPGVIGPAVWNLHCHRISKIEREKERSSEWEGRAARRRFHQLLDDAFSLFPSQSSSPDPLPPPVPTGSNSVSRLQQTDEEEEGVKTVRAWEGREPRPLSAGPFHKVEVEPTWMLADSALRPSDAAAPLIQAIKQELDKFPSVPSSRI